MTKTMLLAAASALTLLALPAAAQSGPPGDCYLCEGKSTTTITQTGVRGTVQLDQTRSSGIQGALIHQGGTDNIVYVKQVSATDQVSIRQLAGTSSARAYVRDTSAYQDGDTLSLVQSAGKNLYFDAERAGLGGNSSITATQSGDHASISVRQTGDQHSAVITQQNVVQTGDFDGLFLRQYGYRQDATMQQVNSKGSTLQLFQGSTIADRSTGGTENSATLMQQGDDHFLRASQAGSNETLFVTQGGTENSIEARQSADPLSYSEQGAGIVQSGTYNVTRLTQTGLGTNAAIYQSGTLNLIALTQASNGASAMITQSGMLNNAQVRQLAQ